MAFTAILRDFYLYYIKISELLIF